MEKMTVIVPAWNEEETLKNCVKKIQTHNPEAHLIIVNNGSTDGTQEWLEQQELDSIYFRLWEKSLIPCWKILV